MKLHIGERIKKRAKDLRIGPTELGKLINTSKQNIYGIFKRQSLDTELLWKLSLALNCDFFAFYSDELSAEDPESFPGKAEVELCRQQLSQCREDLGIWKKQAEFLERLNRLLEEKVNGN